MWISRNRLRRCVGVAREKVFCILMKTRRRKNARGIALQKNLTYRVIGIITTVKIERKEEEEKVIKIALRSTESMNTEKKTETEERKTDCTMIIMRKINTTANEKIEEEERNDEIGTVIKGGVTAKTDRREEVRGTRTVTGEEIIVKRDRKEEVGETSMAIGSVGIVIKRGKGPWRTRTIRDIGTGRTSIKENDKRE